MLTVLAVLLLSVSSIFTATCPGTSPNMPNGATSAATAGTAPAVSPETSIGVRPEPAEHKQDKSVMRQNALPSRSGRRMTVTATAYTKDDAGGEVTYTGTRVTPWHTIAVDPRVIPLGAWVYIPYFKDAPNKGLFHAEDVGGAIKGNRIDIYMESREDALNFGVRELEIMVTEASPDRGSR